jgi:hypothetical protein
VGLFGTLDARHSCRVYRSQICWIGGRNLENRPSVQTWLYVTLRALSPSSTSEKIYQWSSPSKVFRRPHLEMTFP